MFSAKPYISFHFLDYLTLKRKYDFRRPNSASELDNGSIDGLRPLGYGSVQADPRRSLRGERHFVGGPRRWRGNARMEFDAKYLCWLGVGTGVVMVSHANADILEIHSPLDAGLTTAIFHVYVRDIDTPLRAGCRRGSERHHGSPRRVLRRTCL